MTLHFATCAARLALLALTGASVLPAQALKFLAQISKPMEYPWAIAADRTGVYIAGDIRRTYSVTTDERAYIRKFSPDGAEIWTREFDTLSHASGVAANETGVYVAG